MGGYALLLGPHGVHALGKLLGLRKVGQLALHPDHVAEGRVGDGAVDGALAAALVAVVALAGTGRVPVEVDVDAGQALGDGAGFLVALALALREELLDETLLVDVHTGVDGIDDGLVEEAKVGLSEPLVLNGLELCAVLASLLGGDHEIVEGLEGGVGGSEDECVVTGVNGGGDEGGGLGVGTSHSKEVGSYSDCQLEALSESRRFLPIMSAWARMATRRLMCSLMGTSTLPAMCPHFFVPGA